MPPPPLTDEEVRQRVLAWWEGQYEALGINYSVAGLPDNSATKETWLEVTPAIYRREWEKAYRYGLAEDALAGILTKLEAPADPHVRLAKVFTKEDTDRLLRTVSQMCDTEDISDWRIFQSSASLREVPQWGLFLFAVSAACFVLATVTSQPLWAIGGILCCILGIAMTKHVEDKAFRQLFERRINPQITFQQLAEYIQDTAKIQAQEMQRCAKSRLS